MNGNIVAQNTFLINAHARVNRSVLANHHIIANVHVRVNFSAFSNFSAVADVGKSSNVHIVSNFRACRDKTGLFYAGFGSLFCFLIKIEQRGKSPVRVFYFY